MHFLISPAKALNFDQAPASKNTSTLPVFGAQAHALISILETYSSQEIADLMGISEPLSRLNFARYKDWSPNPEQSACKVAVLAFNGDVYAGLDASSLGHADMAWAQKHVGILSGLYGVLRPLDLIQAHRLEMGTNLATPAGKNLYAFWGDAPTHFLNDCLSKEASPVVVNLASQEYARVVSRKILKARVIDCVFEDWKNGEFKVISFFAKRARGLMLRYAVKQRCTQAKQLQAFQLEGYQFAPDVSQVERLVFRRRMPDC
jgi:uncharacterized protein